MSHSSGRAGTLLACILLSFAITGVGQPTARSILCRQGNGSFDVAFRTGVRVRIEATRKRVAGNQEAEMLAERSCAARLGWAGQELVVASDAAELDLDAFGVDLGNGDPVAAFQIRRADGDCCLEYEIYSLEKPPHLLLKLAGGDFFNASDVDLDGRVEIWTGDGAVEGFESLALSELDSAPSVVLRITHGQLEDVSAEFQPYFDREIAQWRDAIRTQDLIDFRSSDGKLAETVTPVNAERLHRLRSVKIKVLEIVWSYLYSGREAEAWRSLAGMWPPADVDRIRAAILKTRARGVHSRAETAASGPLKNRKHAPIFDAVRRAGLGGALPVIPPQAIQIEFPPGSGMQAAGQPGEQLLELIIDAAGKVRSAEPVGEARLISAEQMASVMTWKFVPAFRDGRAVASRLRISVSPKQ